MKTTLRNILRRFPRRRPRQWRYVSPHRRGAGVAILAVVTVGVVAYWVLPGLVNVYARDLAVRYLRAFTGGRVAIDSARFSFFSGIELHGVSVDVPNSPGRERFFQAGTVVLRHRPWSLFTKRRLEATEIVCIAPKVTLEYDAEAKRYTAEELITARRSGGLFAPGGGLSGSLPVISIRDVNLRTLAGRTRLNISMIPSRSGYRITLEEQWAGGREPLRGIWEIDLATGKVRLAESNIPKIDHTDGLLPGRYAVWRKRYEIHGRVVLKGQPATAPAEALLEAHLDNVSLKLQPSEGGLQLTGVRGTLMFQADGVVARGLTGRIPEAGGALFRMSGRYGGYDANSPFDLHLAVENLTLPEGAKAKKWLADMLTFLNETFHPSGRLDIQADFQRLADGQVHLKGTARPRGMSFAYRWFPYRLEQARGAVAFEVSPSAAVVRLVDVTSRRGKMVATANGEIDLRNRGRYDVTVRATEAALDADMRAALSETHQGIWDRFRPQGKTDATVHVRKAGTGTPRDVDVLVSMTGQASAEYEGFPYRLGGLQGRVRIGRREVTIDSVRGRNGPMRCTVDGALSGLGTDDAETNLTISAAEVPLDANVMAALPARVRKAAAGFHATGRAERVSATVRRSGNEPMDLRAVVHLRDASFRADAFPYEVRQVAGVLIVRPKRLIVEELRGLHDKTPIHINGQFVLEANTPGVDLRVRAENVPLDKELFAAAPDGVQRIWRTLAARGRSDVDLVIQHGMDPNDKHLDYRLELKPRDLAVRYEDFPYTLEHITGRAVATPGGVALHGLRASHGKARLTIDGQMTLAETAQDANLSLVGLNVPIDRELLAALPKTLAPLAARFRPGGSCEIRLKTFRIARRDPPRSAPASRVASRPAPGAVSWFVAGRVAFSEATLDLGLGHKTLSGSLDGVARQRGGDLALDAAIALDSVQVARQRLTRFRGRLTKEPRGKVMRLRGLSAKAHGGQVAGFAEIRLADPLAFGVSLSVDAINLADLFAASSAAGTPTPGVQGRLAGNVQLTATVGDKPRRQASGVLRISRAKLYKLPVMLGLLHVVYLSLPGDTAFTDGTLVYHLRNDMLVFDEIYLRGTALSIVGSGTMNMKTEALDLTFLSGPPRKLPRLGSLGELLEGIAREVAEIRVTGTLRKPTMRTVPLRGLDRILRDILNPGRS